MDRRQRNFLIVAAAAVLLFTLVLVILNAIQQRQTVPAPITPVPTLTRIPGLMTPTPAATRQTPSTGQTQTPSLTDTPIATGTPVAAVPTGTGTATQRGPMTFYVAPDGTKTGDGSKEDPWALQDVLDNPDTIRPGDTILLLNGQYMGPFTCWLQGAEGKPITLRPAPGARATLMSNDLVLDVANSAYVNFMDLEITAASNPRDPNNPNESAYGVRINQGKPSHDIKFINLIVHDMPAQGFGWWQANVNSEIYGSLIYFNGITQFDHGIYVHNTDGTKKITDNIIFDNASHGIHAYGEKDYQKIDNIDIEGNTLFDNGSIGYSTTGHTWGKYKRNILVGAVGDILTALNPIIKNNYTYYPNQSGIDLNLGYRSGSVDAIIQDNYFGGGGVEMGGSNTNTSVLQNTVMSLGLNALASFRGGQNDLLLLKPNAPKIFVRPNQYEAGRANVTVYNWSKANQVTLTTENLQGVQIHPGDHYELHNVQDYFNDILTGTYDGTKIDIPMTGHTVAQPMGLTFKPKSSFPEFGAFVLIVQPAN